MRGNQLCYMCGAPAVSKEHVPPKCIFPEQKDIAGQNFRDGLITVPSVMHTIPRNLQTMNF